MSSVARGRVFSTPGTLPGGGALAYMRPKCGMQKNGVVPTTGVHALRIGR